MNITFNNTKEMFIRKGMKEFETVKVEQAIIPFAWYNVKNSYRNNYIRYYIIDENKKPYKSGAIKISDGFYTVSTFNAAVQEQLKEHGYENAIDIKYLETQGRIRIKQNNQTFVPKLHKELSDFLGGDGNYQGVVTDIVTAKNPPNFFAKHYNIYCNIIDSSQNIVNGEESKLLATFIPKFKKYGVSQVFKSDSSRAIENYDYTHIKIVISDENGEVIDFHLPFTVTLRLE